MKLEFDEKERSMIREFVEAQQGREKYMPGGFGGRFYYVFESTSAGFVVTVYDKCTGDCRQVVNEITGN